jgi:hypothetical protein
MSDIRTRHKPHPNPNRYFKEYRLKVGRDIPTAPVDGETVRQHIKTLVSYKMTVAMIARAAGCSDSIVADHLKQKWTNAYRDNANRILSVTPTPHPEQSFCLSIGARRRVEALMAIGWSRPKIAERIGTTADCLYQTLKHDRTTYTTWAAVRDIYEQLSGTPGGDKRIITLARRSGYTPPLAWEGRDIDHPDAQPDWYAAGMKRADIPVCVNNHRYTAENTYYDTRGHRQCRTCRRTAKRRAA